MLWIKCYHMYYAFPSRSNVKISTFLQLITTTYKNCQIPGSFPFTGFLQWKFGTIKSGCSNMVVQNFPIYKDFLLIFFPTDTTASNFGGLCKHNEIGYNDFEKVKWIFKAEIWITK